MNRITTDKQRRELDERIDRGVPTQLNFPECNAAILHMLRALELYWLNIERIRHAQGDAVAEVQLDIATDAAHLCFMWIHKLVSVVRALTVSVATTTKDLEECKELVALAARYAEMCDVMGILWLNQVATTEVVSGEIELDYTADQIRYQAAQWLWRLELTPDVPFPKNAIDELQKAIANLTPESIDQAVLSKLDPAIFKAIHSHVIDLSNNLWQLPNSMDLSAFSTHEFGEFWTALRTIVGVHKFVFNGVVDRNIDAAVPVLTPKQWCEIIADMSGLTHDKVTAIIDYLTYDMSLIQKTGDKKHKTEAICLPFFKLGAQQLAASPLLVLNSSAERNLFDLAMTREGAKYDRLKESKESQWSEDLAARFKKYGLVAVPLLEYPGGDIDLFVMDPKIKVALVVQLKWLLMNRIKSGHVDDALTAFDQAKRAVRWIEENPKDAAERLKLTTIEVTSVQLRPLAVIKESLLNGFAVDPDVPLLNGTIFDALIDYTKGDLNRLWQILFTEQSHLPVADRDFEVKEGFVPIDGKSFGDVRFKRPELHALSRSPWNWRSIISP